MRIEYAAVRRSLNRAALASVRVIQTGIGRDPILSTLRHLLDDQSSSAHASSPVRALILAGACGALRSVEDVPPIARIIDQTGTEWVCTHAPKHTLSNADDAHTCGVTLIGVDEIIGTPAAKAELAARSGAAIVDMESHAFAGACQHRGIVWHIVRGVSDTPDETLPDKVLGWIDPSGNTRAARAIIDLASDPRLIPHMLTVMRRSNRVLPRVGDQVALTIKSWSRS